MVSGAIGATKQEVEVAVAEYTVQKMAGQNVPVVQDENKSQNEISLRDLFIYTHLYNNRNVYSIVGCVLGTIGFMGMAVDGLVGFGIATISTIGAVFGGLALYSSEIHNEIFKRNYIRIDQMEDISKKEKDSLQRQAFANWIYGVTGLEEKQHNPGTGIVFYNAMKK